MTPSSKQILVGLPATGKTTFLAALWHIVDSGEVVGSLQLKELHGDREHLNKIRENWVNCQPIGRTAIAGERLVSMRLIESGTGKITEVYFPDMSGESFRLQWSERRWTRDYGQLVSEAAGILLFLHPNEVVEPVRIDAADPLVGELGDEEHSAESSAQEQFVPWAPDRAPVQVQLVELIQFVTTRPEARLPLRVSVIISAWDLVSGEGKSPEAWVASRLPLLAQYLRANPEVFETRVYGVSAQGGDLGTDAPRLLNTLRPSERIVVEGQQCAPNDLTAPVRWIMS